MRVFLTKTKSVSVATFAEASAAVRKHIDDNDLGAGCGSSLEAFVGGKINPNLVARWAASPTMAASGIWMAAKSSAEILTCNPAADYGNNGDQP